MKIETKFGLGEIAYYSKHNCERGSKLDEFVEVIGIYIDKQGVKYHCRWPNGIVGAFDECELTNDPDFDQETGYSIDPHPEKELNNKG